MIIAKPTYPYLAFSGKVITIKILYLSTKEEQKQCAPPGLLL